ncbi:Ger(x)C family spore germination protein [Paenibacillus ihumii]|uniref:Ger(x)C family spore germination protein n=1 Tax=Paenibacillus ihumii TaxID=687436 RepID=UPI0006D85963|nr:Ger(x)C family spore germination protein [Paenibacillus ihumii]
MRRLFPKLAFSLFILFNTAGCWSKVELDERAFVNGLYLDVGESPGTVAVTISTPLSNRLQSGQETGGGSSSEKPYSLLTQQSTSISKALETIHKDLSRQLSLSEIKIVMISQEYAKQGIADLLEWIKREPDVPIGAYILVTSGDLQETAHLTPVFEQLPTAVLLSFASQGYMLNTTIRDCIVSETAGLGFAVTQLKSGTITSAADAGKKEPWAGIQGAALFQQDKLKGTLPYEEAKIIAWARGNLKSPIYSVQWDEAKSNADVKFTYTSGRTSVKMTENGPVFTVHLKGRASILAKKDALNRPVKNISGMILDGLEHKITADFNKSIAATQQAGADVLELGFLLEWNYPRFWNKVKESWPEFYRHHAKINLVTNFTFDDFGKEY